MKCPCKGCTKRSVLCHVDCPGYLKFAEECEKERQRRLMDGRSRPAFVSKSAPLYGYGIQ